MRPVFEVMSVNLRTDKANATPTHRLEPIGEKRTLTSLACLDGMDGATRYGPIGFRHAPLDVGIIETMDCDWKASNMQYIPHSLVRPGVRAYLMINGHFKLRPCTGALQDDAGIGLKICFCLRV